ncbi:serine/threonine protein phosphatase [Haloferax mediterranei ATCC 33500]|uniref:Phosphohydrolase n=1 Tax=Haloferax mediterranei (strain ATCC 33500 / DSM 1411 / JCM 8866 / NBRC 14739 / NCIMB 2177 / R-4) TaxID=523841 RepID=I3R361_HALMT|nr:metallophosphoesterase [Haloferax mediterranei]AFK18671.1 putative phosphohydrolase [Haloferax mediterranei ATCC 33500]AHZ21958.1 serine/threonine protein phosphatase [Haloferax mediterranei ATCC 33500]EMA03469.1 putative phosphohydrolase [Haloferax mediterranei ATCC 33500]MDX5988767.1 metallophosphoesterase [Haloferax mediterranei ATCC 33500]QCQ75171.1 serine/threonine protein phosphatase [Haloferax mediterranei ATCC 33500]
MKTARPNSPGPVLARLARPVSRTPTRIAVVADPHVTPTGSGTWKVYHRTENRLRTAVSTISDLDVDATVLLGDLTRDGRPGEYDVVDEILGGLPNSWVSVPGNHDVPKYWDDYEAPTAGQFAARYATGELPFVHRVGGVDVIGLDSATGGPDIDLSDSHEGVIPDSNLHWLDEHLADATTPLVVLHHNLFHPRQHTGQFPDGDFYQLRNADELTEVLARHSVPLVFSGHIHWPATAVRDGVREITAPATCSFPQSFLLVELDRKGTTIRLVPLAGPKGMAEAYTLASSGSAHGQGIVAHADRSVLSTFPLVDERTLSSQSVGADVPGAVRWR